MKRGAAKNGNREWLWGLALVAAVVLAYQPVWTAGFVWDDDSVFVSNPCVAGPLGLKEIWTTTAADICPLTLSTFWVEHALWGIAPLPYHLVNVLMHGACAVALWRVLLRLRVAGAWLGAALWALHPVQVESVAWVTEMKNTESGLFYLLAALFFIRGLGKPVGWEYGLTLLFAAMAMASKSSTVILPLVLPLCAWWMEGRWKWNRLLRVSPMFLMAIVAGSVSIWTQKAQGGTEPQWATVWGRLATAGDDVWFYLGKLAWPQPLIVIYPHGRIDKASWVSYLPALVALAVLAVLWAQGKAWARPYQFCGAYFVIALLPVLGVANLSYFTNSFVADHFQYLAGMGPLALAGAGLAQVADRLPRRTIFRFAPAAFAMLVLGFWSWDRAWVYQSSETLWIDTLAKNPDCWTADDNLGLALADEGREEEAIGYYEKALAQSASHVPGRRNDSSNPRYAQTCNSIGNAYLREHRLDAAIEEYRQSIAAKPDYAEAHNNFGFALLSEGKVDEAIAQFQQALKINPIDGGAHNNLGIALAKTGHMREAWAQFKEAVRLMPDSENARQNLAKAEAQLGGSQAAP